MQSNLIHTTLGDVCIKITDGAHASPKSVPYGKPMASVKDLTRFGININSARHISLADYHALVKQGCRPTIGDVLIAKDGNTALDTVCSIKTNDEVVLLSSVAILKPDPSKIDSDFLKHYLSSQDVISYLKATFISGAAIPRVILRAFKQAEIAIPDIVAQKIIASILNAIDDKILNLTNTNATLEAIAQTIFKSWFVNFDPVHAKQKGLPCVGIDAETADLFPNSFEDSELGLIPKGWEVINVGQVATITKGKSYTSAELVPNEETALVTLKSFVRGGGFRLDGFKPYIGKFKPEQVVKAGDLIVAYTDVTQDAALIGKPAIVIGVERYSTLVASLDLGIIRALDNISSTQFLYGLFKTDNFQSHTYAHTSGTTVLHMSKDAISSYKFVNPPNRLIKKFNAIAETLSQRIQINNSQILNLAELRDTILPRLINGTLDVSAIEAQLKETA